MTLMEKQKAMKTINVSATQDQNENEEVVYAINGQFGIETTSHEDEACYFPERIKCVVSVGQMFAGTHQDWQKYIDECVIDELTKQGLTYENSYGVFIK